MHTPDNQDTLFAWTATFANSHTSPFTFTVQSPYVGIYDYVVDISPTFESSIGACTWASFSTMTTGLTWLQFEALFTTAEQAAILTSTDAQVMIFRQEAIGAGGQSAINLTDANVIAGVNYLASINLIASARVAQILAGQPQSAPL